MKILFNSILIILICVGINSCKSESGEIKEDILLGTWVLSGVEKGLYAFEKEKMFNNNRPGIRFDSKGKLIKHQNVGWCVTPPITFGEFNGKWKKISDSLLKISYDYWGGIAEEVWKIIELNSSVFKVKVKHYPNKKEIQKCYLPNNLNLLLLYL